MNQSDHDPIICGLDWDCTCDWCRTLHPCYQAYMDQIKPKESPKEPSEQVMPQRPEEWVTLDFDEILAEGRSAFKILTTGGQEIWIPFSQIENEGQEYRAGYKNGSMFVTAWIAKEKGINEGSQEPQRPREDFPQEDYDQYEGYEYE